MRAEAVSGLYRDITFPEPPSHRPYVYLNMVMSLDGKATIDDTERGLGSPRDQRLMRELRLHADMVMNGAATLRISGTSSTLTDEDLVRTRMDRKGNQAAIAAVVSRSGNLPLTRRFFTSDAFDAVVFISSHAEREAVERLRSTGRTVVEIPDGDDGLVAMCTIIREQFDVRRLLVEGGPTLNGGLLRMGLVDEMFLTMSGKIVGGPENLSVVESGQFSVEAVPKLTAISFQYNEDDDEFYFRWRVRRGT